jgi:hypothetical protein
MYSSRIQVGKQKEEIKLPTHSTRMLGDDLRLIGILPGECRASQCGYHCVHHAFVEKDSPSKESDFSSSLTLFIY